MQSNNPNKSVLISTISAKGFSSIFLGFMISISAVMLITMALPITYKVSSLNSTCAFNNYQSCLSNLVENGSNFTIKVNEIASTNQKVYIYLIYETLTTPRGRVKMDVNTAIYKPKENVQTISTYADVELFKFNKKTHRAFCDSETNNCEMLLATIEASKKYEEIYAVFNVTSSEVSTGLSQPTLSIVYVNSEYTSFEVFWRISFLILMCVCAMFYMWTLRSMPFGQWSIEQKCTLFLMIAIAITNNGFYAYEFISANEFFPTINAVCDSIMLCSLLLYILVIMDALRKPLSQRTLFGFYLPRVALVILLNAFVVNLYIYNNENSDPVMIMMKDTTNAVLASLTVIFTLIYLFWLVFAVIRSFSEARKLGEIGHRIKSYGLFTLVAVCLLILLLVSQYFMGYKNNQGIYLTVIGYMNIYAIVLMVFYLPSNKHSEDWTTKRKEIVLDEFKVTEYDDEDNELVIEENNDEELLMSTVADEILNNDDKPIDL